MRAVATDWVRAMRAVVADAALKRLQWRHQPSWRSTARACTLLITRGNGGGSVCGGGWGGEEREGGGSRAAGGRGGGGGGGARGGGGGGFDVRLDETCVAPDETSHCTKFSDPTPGMTHGVGVTGTRRPRGRSPKNVSKMRQNPPHSTRLGSTFQLLASVHSPHPCLPPSGNHHRGQQSAYIGNVVPNEEPESASEAWPQTRPVTWAGCPGQQAS